MNALSYCEAINLALTEEMESDPKVFVFGIGVPDHKRIFGSTNGLVEKFGTDRCFDTPIAEDSMTGFALGAALAGFKPIHTHIRVDFLLLALNQIGNLISSFCYGTAGKTSVPLVIRAVIGRGWGQGYQHSKSLHSTFAHFPGLKVVAPTTVADAYHLTRSAIQDPNPVLVLEHRWLYWQTGELNPSNYDKNLGVSRILLHGNDLSVIATSWMNIEALQAANILEELHGIHIEVVDPRTFSPMDFSIMADSVKRTGHCIVADNDWVFCGLSAEIAAALSERCFAELKSPIERIGFLHVPCPTARHLEDEFYPNAFSIVRAVERKLSLPHRALDKYKLYSHENKFKGPF